MNTNAQSALSNTYLKESDAILLNKGKTFYWARFFLSQLSAQRATRLYRFCRFIDDLADEATDKTAVKASLSLIKSELKASHSDHAVIIDAIQLFKECDIPINIPCELINGVMSDLSSVSVKTEGELLVYCYRVAGTVGIMMCKVLNVSNHVALFHAIDLGIAMQITNICRDVYEDALIGRVYLPASITGPMTSETILKKERVKFPISLLRILSIQYRFSSLRVMHNQIFRKSIAYVADRLSRSVSYRIFSNCPWYTNHLQMKVLKITNLGHRLFRRDGR